ncbi:MAG: rubredoxin family protein [Hydrocarboniphaga sp.]|uniref:hypothetical protein n=1 Tax=Hydrocarboniphaga sp. TaxID=2033016 RepID=UPI0026245008|nr:hypothetical protein [Hydrocarboniphaga sp.]MDB5971116.1 rubredoxin family protein [Hydrocarboniphaga sp.]
MTDDLFLQSRFFRWCTEHAPLKYDEEQALRREALSVLVESINAGEIISLDGIDTPLSKKIKAHHQLANFEMNSNWIGSSQDWMCPCCSRSKFQIARVGKKRQILAKLVVHHDHMGGALEAVFHAAFEKAGTSVEQVEGLRLVERMGSAFAAYEEVLICEDCNNADTEAKKLVESPLFFSFSPGQIKRFIRCGDHQPHQVDATMAQQIWQEAKPAYELRMKLIRAVGHAAATDAHWYEPYPRRTSAIPVFGYGDSVIYRSSDRTIQQWVSGEALYRALGPGKAASARNLSRWRTTVPKPGKALPDNFLAMLRSEEARARTWNSVSENWRCPICRRSKQETTYVGEKNKISFYLQTNRGFGKWVNASTICNHCGSTLMSLKLEVSELLGCTPTDSYGFVSPEELAKVIIPSAHSPHSILPAEAEALVSLVVQRLAQS